MKALWPILDLLDRRGKTQGRWDLPSLGKATAAALSGIFLLALDLAARVGALVTNDRALRYHLQTAVIALLAVVSVIAFMASEPGTLPSQRTYRYSQAMRTVAKVGSIALLVALVIRIYHVWPGDGQRHVGYLCDTASGRPARATSVEVRSIFDEPLGAPSAVGSDGSFVVVVPPGEHDAERLVFSGACAGSVGIRASRRGLGCNGDADSPEAPAWNVTCGVHR